MTDQEREERIARMNMDRATIRAFLEVLVTLDELKLSVGYLHERFLSEDSDKVIGEMNHRITKRVADELLKVEQKNPSYAAWLDDLGRKSDVAPPQP